MIINLQHKFKPTDVSPGPQEGQEVCVHSGLTNYAAECEVPAFVLEVWEGEGEDTRLTNYLVIDKNTKQIVFADHRHDVIEYIIECFGEQMHNAEQSVECAESAQNSSITEDNKKDD